jgi:hypothetical protein
MQNILDRLMNNKQMLAIVMFIVAGVLLMDLNYRISEYFTVTAERDKVETQVYGLWVTREVLKTESAFAESDAAFEKSIREELKMAKPDDIRVVPIPQEGTAPTPVPEVKLTQRSYQYWEYWWALFFE